MAQKAFFTLEFLGGQKVINELAEVELELDKLAKQIKEAKKLGQDDIYKSLRLQQEDLKKASTTLRAELKAQSREFENVKYPATSVIGLEQEYSKLRATIRGMSKEARESADGISKIKLAEQLKSQVIQIDGSIKDFKSNIGNYKSAFSGIGDLLTGGLITGGATAAIGAIVSFGQASTQAFKESEIAITAVKTAVETTGAVAGFTTEQLATEAERLMKNTVFDDDQILKDVTSQLLTFTNVTGDSFLRAQEAALDLNTVLGGDLQGTTIQLGKALENPIKGVTALSKAGVTFTEQQKAQIKVLVESNKVQEAQALILDEINAKYGNQAEALAKTDTGKLKQASNIIGELQEKLGGFIVGGLAKLAPLFNYLVDGIGRAFDFIYENVIKPISDAFGSLFSQLGETSGATAIFEKAMSQLGIIISSIGSILGTVIQYIADTIGWFKKLGQDVPLVGSAFSFIKGKIDGFVDTITNIPALLAGVFKGFAQFVSNIRNLDFSKGAIDVGVNEFKRITQERVNKQITEDLTKPKANGAGTPKGGTAKDDGKAAKAEKKLTDDQLKRIGEIQQKIQELASAKITNEFDKQIEAARQKAASTVRKLGVDLKEIEGKKIQTKNDAKEADLIKQETAAIKSALTDQVKAIEEKRAEAAKAATDQLERLRDENLKLLQQAQLEQVQTALDIINGETGNRLATIELKYALDEGRLKDQLEQGLITQADYDKQVKLLNDNKNDELLSAEKDAAAERLKIYDLELEQKKALILIDKQNAITALNDKTNALIEKEKERFKKQGGDAQDHADTLIHIADNAQLEAEKIRNKALTDEQKAVLTTEKLKLDSSNKIAETNKENNKKDLEERQKNLAQIADATLNIAGQISDALFGGAQDSADREKEARLKALDDEYAKKLDAAKGNATLEAGLKKQLEAEKNEIEKKAFEENKKRQIAQAIINGALAITNILATVPKFDFGIASAIQIAVTAASTAIQVATIKGQKFARGGFTGRGAGAPDETGKVPVGVVHANEWVASEEMIARNPGLFEFLEARQRNDTIFDRTEKMFARGGFTSDNIPNLTGLGRSNSVNAVMTNEQVAIIAREVAAQVYEASRQGTQEGAKTGTYNGLDTRNRQAEREAVLNNNTTF